jgi:hypothetical protein
MENLHINPMLKKKQQEMMMMMMMNYFKLHNKCCIGSYILVIKIKDSKNLPALQNFACHFVVSVSI